MPFVRTNATLVTIFAGGNEINTITAALGGGAGASDQAGYIDAQVNAFGADYATLLNGIRSRAGSARIIALNVPNLAGFPFLAERVAPAAPGRAARRRRHDETVVNALVSQNVTVIDLMCDARMYLPSNYSADGFHPNDAGYAFIAGEVVRAATSSCVSGAAERAAASCRWSRTRRPRMHFDRSRRAPRGRPEGAAPRRRRSATFSRRSRAGNGPQDSTRPAFAMPPACCWSFRSTDRAHIVLTVRADTLGRHGGQVSLPGGVVEPGETFEQAALREAHEEVGLPSGGGARARAR